jgi:hypothetical protein
MARRWEGDERGEGVADARGYVRGASELVAAMQAPGWVAEQPEKHLLRHLEAACGPSSFDLHGTRTCDDGTFEVDLSWRGQAAGVGAMRRSLFAVAGSIAETATYVRQRREADGGVVFELVTGEIGDGLSFAPHGHAVRFVIRP